MLTRPRQGKLRTPACAHAKTRSVCTRSKAASACLRHCQKVVNRSIVKFIVSMITGIQMQIWHSIHEISKCTGYVMCSCYEWRCKKLLPILLYNLDDNRWYSSPTSVSLLKKERFWCINKHKYRYAHDGSTIWACAMWFNWVTYTSELS